MQSKRMVDDLGKTISKLTNLWLAWLAWDEILNNPSEPIDKRSYAAIQCEYLVNLKYNLIREIDELFEERFRIPH